jgi:PAB1-binding protein PBP1
MIRNACPIMRYLPIGSLHLYQQEVSNARGRPTNIKNSQYLGIPTEGVNGAMMPNQNISQEKMHPNVIKVVFMAYG